jgi:hypothetical protein
LPNTTVLEVGEISEVKKDKTQELTV